MGFAKGDEERNGAGLYCDEKGVCEAESTPVVKNGQEGTGKGVKKEGKVKGGLPFLSTQA